MSADDGWDEPTGYCIDHGSYDPAGDCPGCLQGRNPVAWNDFVRHRIPGDPLDGAPGVTRFRSSEYTCSVTELEDGSHWISLSRYGSRGPVRDWRHLQVIKNLLTDPEREAVMLFPAESRLVDSADQTHLWVLPPRMQVPFGYARREVAGPHRAGRTGGAQRPFEPGTVPPEGADADLPEPFAQGFVGPRPRWVVEGWRPQRKAVQP